MIKQFLEGFAFGFIIKSIGVKTVIFWFFIVLAIFLAGFTIFLLDHQGSDLSLVYSILKYVGKLFIIFFLFFMGRALVRNLKILIPVVICIGITCYMQVSLGMSISNASLAFLGFVVPLLAVWIIDKFIMKIQKKHKALTTK